jgi:hypothetical protein
MMTACCGGAWGARRNPPRRYPQSLDILYRDAGSASMAHACPGLAVIGAHVGTRLDSTDHGRKVLFEIYEMILAEQDRRPAALSGLNHQDFVEVH